MAKQAYVYSGTDWVPLASEVTNLSSYYTKGEVDTSFQTKATTGLVLLNTTSFSGVSSVSAPNGTFSATYDNYLIKMNNVSNSGTNWNGIRMRANGVDDSGANYRRQKFQASNTSISGQRFTGSTLFEEMIRINTSIPNFCDIQIQNPFLTEITTAEARVTLDSDGNIEYMMMGYGLNTTTSYDSFTVIPAAGTITGSMSVYGFSK